MNHARKIHPQSKVAYPACLYSQDEQLQGVTTDDPKKVDCPLCRRVTGIGLA